MLTNLFLEKKIKMADSKKLIFSTLLILNIFLPKFQKLVLGSVGELYMKDMNVAQPMGSSGCLILGLKQTKNTKKAFFACLRPDIRQPDDPIS